MTANSNPSTKELEDILGFIDNRLAKLEPLKEDTTDDKLN